MLLMSSVRVEFVRLSNNTYVLRESIVKVKRALPFNMYGLFGYSNVYVYCRDGRRHIVEISGLSSLDVSPETILNKRTTSYML
jgi:hypothetical protein